MRYVLSILCVIVLAFSLIGHAAESTFTLAAPYPVQSSTFSVVLKGSIESGSGGWIPCSIAIGACTAIYAEMRTEGGAHLRYQIWINGQPAPLQSASNADGSVTYTAIVAVPPGQPNSVKVKVAKKADTDPDQRVDAMTLKVIAN